MSVRIRILDWSCVPAKEKISSFFGSTEKARLEKIKNPSRRQESGTALVALYDLVENIGSCAIIRDENGRPHFKEDIGIDFNTSHSGTLCAVGVLDGYKGRIGIDIELVNREKTEIQSRVATRYFSEREREVLDNSSSAIEFYKIWTAKEAVAKLLGIGLSRMLRDNEHTTEKYNLSQFLVSYREEQYVLSVCTEKKIEKIDFACGDGITQFAV